jgi:3-oxoacyl-(acyl-carrier-protein) synthase
LSPATADAGPRRIVLTGAGAVSPYGIGVDRLRAGIESGRAAGIESGIPAVVVGDPLASGDFAPLAWRRLDRVSKMAVIAVRESIAAAGIGDPAPAGIVLGTMTAGTTPLEEYLGTMAADGIDAASPMIFPFTVSNAPAAQCSILIGLKGPGLTVCRMEASGLGAVVVGCDLIRAGAAPVVVAGGADDRPPLLLEAWRRLRLIPRAGAPPPAAGFVPGEGAYMVTLEPADAARARGAPIRAEILGAGMAHAGRGPRRRPGVIGPAVGTVRAALATAGVAPGDLGAVVTAANGAPALAAFETAVLREAIGGGADRLPARNVKRLVGESGAASACGLLAAVLCGPRIESPILVHALGTGGACVSLVLVRAPGS